MIANENQYRVTKEQERKFARLESGGAPSVANEPPAIRQAKLDAAKSVLRDLRQEIKDWDAMHRTHNADPADADRVARAIAGIFDNADASRRANELRPCLTKPWTLTRTTASSRCRPTPTCRPTRTASPAATAS